MFGINCSDMGQQYSNALNKFKTQALTYGTQSGNEKINVKISPSEITIIIPQATYILKLEEIENKSGGVAFKPFSIRINDKNGYRNISERNLVYPRELQNIKMLLEKKIAMTLVDTFDYGFVKDILDNINELQKYFNKKRLCESIKEAQQKNNEPTAPKRYH
jgi:hypothetical protein